MAPDNREKNFDKALARNLRVNSPSGAAQHHSCADAEILAAYQERLLAPQELVFWKQHISACSRCRQVLALLETSDAIPAALHQQHEEEKFAVAASISVPEYIEEATLSAVEPQAAGASASPRQFPSPRRAAYWRWLAPAGAIAASLLVWATLQPTMRRLPRSGEVPKPKQAAKQEQVEVAQNRQPASPPAPTPVQPMAQSANASDSMATPANSRIAEPPKRTRFAQVPLGDKILKRDAEAVPIPSQQAEALPIAPRAAPKGERPAARQFDNASGALMAGAPKESAVSGREEKQLEKAAASNVSSQPAPPKPASNSVILNSAAQAEVASKSKPAGGAIAGGALTKDQQKKPAMDSVGRLTSTAELRMAADKVATVVSAPGGKILWLAGAAGLIEQSNDAGSTWTLQASGVVGDFLAGSAPSDKVCWLVGRAGTIVRTTDGGAHWAKVLPPVPGDLDQVFAVNGRQATVSDAASHHTYITTDGGNAWKLASE